MYGVSCTLCSVVQALHRYIQAFQVSNAAHVDIDSHSIGVHRCYLLHKYIQAFQVSNTAHVTSFKSIHTQMHESSPPLPTYLPRSLLLAIDVVNSARRGFGRERETYFDRNN